MSAYGYLVKMRILTTLAYRFDVFASILSNLVILIASVFLWKTAYAGDHGAGAGAGVNEHQMIVYSIVSALLGSLFITDVQNTINQRVREGDISVDMLKPMPMLGYFLAQDIGSVVSALLNRSLPMLLFVAVFFVMPAPAGFSAFLLFLLSALLAYAILWLLSALVGMTAFWVMELGNMGIVKDLIVRVLSGSLVPLWWFPHWMQEVSRYLPFQYTYQTPLGIYIGRTGPSEAFFAMGIQAVWIALLVLLLYAVWSKAKRKTEVQGG